ncbi:SpoIIE family protein phosphatase [Streptomyces sp. FIT100]|uniref:SpoIIE family protein phosphatase n=1 Tax=Streptomyces sp. FIT100 TaxID=2837956 RepID=UPI0021C732BB|nr:SpoIIE family protein phosphatase [Streptomyces sp. FIT100]UUN25270.1 SpoIIE family protein phosphatase [Streptomyces sp. FIT100]
MVGDAPLMVVDDAGTVVQWSIEAERLLDLRPEEAIGQSAVRLMIRAADNAGSTLRMAGDFTVRSLSRVDDSMVWAVYQAPKPSDADERAKATARFRVLDAVREHVGSSLDVVATCRELVETLVPDFADVAVVDVVDAVVRGEEPPLGPLRRDVPLRRAAFWPKGYEQWQSHPLGDIRPLPFPSPYGQALADLKPRVVSLGPDVPWLRADPVRAKSIGEAGAHTLIAAPLTVRGTVLGLLSLYRGGKTSAFDAEEVKLALELASHTAWCVENARCYVREHTIAAALQRRLLPPHLSEQTAMETAHLYTPGNQGGGAWFDTFSLSGARTALVVGEVAGRGIYAATTMGQLRTVVHTLAALDLEPDELLARLSDTAARLADERAALPPGDPLHQQALEASCVFAVYDPLALTCTFACADHPTPVIVQSGKVVDVPDVPTGPPLGSPEGSPFAATTVDVTEGSVMALFTKALLPATRPGAPGDDEAEIRDALGESDRPLQDLCDQVLYRLHEVPPAGDAVLLLARSHAFPVDRVAEWNLERDPSAAHAARDATERQLGRWGVDEEATFAANLIVSELVTNALRYGTGLLRLRLIMGRTTLTCEVHDGSAAAPRLRHAKTLDEGGRGLFLVSQIAENWGTRYVRNGKLVWTELALPSRQDP